MGNLRIWPVERSLHCSKAEHIGADQDNISLLPTAQTAGGVELKREFISLFRILSRIVK